MSAPTYLLYTSNLDAAEAKVYVEMREVTAVPRAGELVTIDRIEYKIARLVWDVFSEPKKGELPGHRYPQQHATALVVRRSRR